MSERCVRRTTEVRIFCSVLLVHCDKYCPFRQSQSILPFVQGISQSMIGSTLWPKSEAKENREKVGARATRKRRAVTRLWSAVTPMLSIRD
jgi:hypothetical protein